MEQYDSFNPIDIQLLLKKIENIGFISPKKQIVLRDDILQICDDLINQFIQSKQQSLICFFLECTFLKTESKSLTYDFFNSYLNSLQQQNTKLSSIFLYFFQIDECQTLSNVYCQSISHIKSFTKLKKIHQLDNIKLKFNDIINLAQLIFDDISIDNIIKLLQQELIKDNSTLNPLIEISCSHFVQLMLIYKQSYIELEPFRTPQKKSPQRNSKSPNKKLSGFYKWKSPFFNSQDFYKNPVNKKLLEDLEKQAKKYPKTRQGGSQHNYYSPLTPTKTRSDFLSKDSVDSDFIKLKSDQSKKLNQSIHQLSELSFSEKKSDPIKQNGCIYSYEVPTNQNELQKIIRQYQIQYFDPSINLPKPLATQITYENLIDLFTELEQEVTFRKTTYKAIQYFASIDPRYLQISKGEKIEAISAVEGWILGKNEFGHIGCCAETYIQRI